MPGKVEKTPSPAGTAEKKGLFSGVPAGLVVTPSNPGVQTPGYFSRRGGIPPGHSVFGCPKIKMRPSDPAAIAIIFVKPAGTFV
jgi:hypothetical protein